MDTFSEILKEFGKKVGLSELSLDENGYCCLSFDDVVLNIELDENSELLFVYSNLGDLPENSRESFYEMLLCANCLYRETQGGVLGVDKDASIVVYSYQIPVRALDELKFERIIENFVNMAEFWTEKIKGFGLDKSFELSSVPEEGIKV